MLVVIVLGIILFVSGVYLGYYLCHKYGDHNNIPESWIQTTKEPVNTSIPPLDRCEEFGHYIFELITRQVAPGTNRVTKNKQHYRSCCQCGATETGTPGTNGDNDQFTILHGAVSSRP